MSELRIGILVFGAVFSPAFVWAANVSVIDCPKCDCIARYDDDGKSVMANRARFSDSYVESGYEARVVAFDC